MTEHDSFYLCSQKRKYYSECLSDVRNYLTSHSDILRCCKLNNQKGLQILLDGLFARLDDFCRVGDSVELYLDSDSMTVR